MAVMDEQLEFVKQIASRLDAAGIRYMLTGSMAMAIYAVPRMTRDIDLVIECRPEDAPRIAALFEADCYVDVERIRKAATGRSMFNIIHYEWIIKADFIVRKDEAYRKAEFDRRARFDIEGASIWVVAPEDLILSKIKWSADSNSELQQRDVQALEESVADLDWDYLEQWAVTLGVKDMLDRVKRR